MASLEKVFDMDVKRYLPEEFDHLIIISACSPPEHFSCEIRSNLVSVEDITTWVKKFEMLTSTSWFVRHSKNNAVGDGASRFVASRDYACHQSSYRRRKNEVTSGNQDCKASLKFRIKANTKHTRKRDGYIKQGLICIIKVYFYHSHVINCTESWKWLRRSDETREAFIRYFNEGMSRYAARRYHEDLVLKNGPAQLRNSYINPPKDCVYKWYQNWRKENHGDLKSEPNFPRLSSSPHAIANPSGRNMFQADSISPSSSCPTDDFITETNPVARREMVYKQFCSILDQMKCILNENLSDTGLLKKAEDFSMKYKSLHTAMQLYNHLGSLTRQSENKKVQPTSSVKRCPCQDENRPKKRLCGLDMNVLQNQSNAKSHGDVQ